MLSRNRSALLPSFTIQMRRTAFSLERLASRPMRCREERWNVHVNRRDERDDQDERGRPKGMQATTVIGAVRPRRSRISACHMVATLVPRKCVNRDSPTLHRRLQQVLPSDCGIALYQASAEDLVTFIGPLWRQVESETVACQRCQHETDEIGDCGYCPDWCEAWCTHAHCDCFGEE